MARYLVALAGPLMLAGLLTGSAAAAPAAAPACKTWMAVPPLNPGTQDNELSSVTVLSPSDAWAVGFSHDNGPEQTLTEHWDGSSWQVVPSPHPGTGDNTLFGVRAAGPSSVWAVGSFVSGSGPASVEKTLILHWDGTQWARQSSPNPGTAFNGLTSVRVVSARDVWAVGSYSNGGAGKVRSLILHWNGSTWRQVASPSPAALNDLNWVAATSPSNAWAVGLLSDTVNLTRRGFGPAPHRAAKSDRTFILHWNGTRWRQVASPSPGPVAFLSGVGATSASNAWAVGVTSAGGIDQTLILRWNGSAWKRAASPDPGGSGTGNDLTAVNATSDANAWAVGDFSGTGGTQQAMLLRWNGTRWRQVQIPPSGTSSALLGVGASAAGNAWAVGTFVSVPTGQTLPVGQTLALHCT